ncbi:hypothetical protein M409DRAFT_23263 [Zasmidium cellare ATCC 36951]|uniref:Small ribosomal subunit protein mS41 n=1 Tax=Zasmidium cellare ATCC 36951 TaxID=1080233 RepID=A0A6A6CKE9_ZASCE|nr:uncharacterized protein M409DRAFT_23263 [Zasmidium cellare ATCC 36951]KAF2166630.1 hypothetical protein M409DRAFT_23263 [Zasmidium cellare ATCC 36951]
MASKRPLALLSLPTALRQTTCFQCQTQVRGMHKLNTALRVPKPTPFVPDVPAFLTLIGRNMSAHAGKIPSWEALFTLSSQQLRESGVEPARARRYVLWWRDRFRNGIHGIGGDLTEVKDGIAELRIAEVPVAKGADAPATVSRDAGTRKVIVNVRPTVTLPEDPANPKPKEGKKSILEALAPPLRLKEGQVKPVEGFKIVTGNKIGGTGVEYIKGHMGVARLRVQDGLWEQRRGHKVDGEPVYYCIFAPRDREPDSSPSAPPKSGRHR